MSPSGNFEGQRIKGDKEDCIYLVLDDKLRAIANPDVYEALFGSKQMTFETVPQPMVDRFDKGPTLDQRPSLVKGFDDPVYLIDDKKKRWITNPDVFNRYAFSGDKITFIGSIVDLVPSGPDIK